MPFFRRSRVSWLSFLQPLLLLGVLLLQLLCLLLMPLLDLLLLGFIGIPSPELLVFLFLLLLQFLPFFVLLREQLFLLLLVFSVLLGVACIRRAGALHRRKLVRMHRARATSIVSWRRIPRAYIRTTHIVNRTRLSRGHDSPFVKCSRLGSRSDWWFSTVFRSP